MLDKNNKRHVNCYGQEYRYNLGKKAFTKLLHQQKQKKTRKIVFHLSQLLDTAGALHSNT